MLPLIESTYSILNSELPLIDYPTDLLKVESWLRFFGEYHEILGFENPIFEASSKDWLHEEENLDINFARSFTMSDGNVFIGLFKTGKEYDRIYLVCWEKVGKNYQSMYQIGWKKGKLLPDYPRTQEELGQPEPLKELIDRWTFTEGEYVNKNGEIRLYSIQMNPRFFEVINWFNIPFELLAGD